MVASDLNGMAASISMSPTICARTSSFSIRATARSMTSPKARAPATTRRRDPRWDGSRCRRRQRRRLARSVCHQFCWNERRGSFIEPRRRNFEDQTPTSGMAGDSVPWVGWGCALAISTTTAGPIASSPTATWTTTSCSWVKIPRTPHPALLHRNMAGSRFRLATRDAGPYFDPTTWAGEPRSATSTTTATSISWSITRMCSGSVRNDTKSSNHWIRLSLVGTVSNRDAVGALVTIQIQSRTLVRQRKGGASLESSHDPRLLFGLGQETVAPQGVDPLAQRSCYDRGEARSRSELFGRRASGQKPPRHARRISGDSKPRRFLLLCGLVFPTDRAGTFHLRGLREFKSRAKWDDLTETRVTRARFLPNRALDRRAHWPSQVRCSMAGAWPVHAGGGLPPQRRG